MKLKGVFMPSIKTRIKRMNFKENALNRKATFYISAAIIGLGFISAFLTKPKFEPPCPLYGMADLIALENKPCLAEAYISRFEPISEKIKEPSKIWESPFKSGQIDKIQYKPKKDNQIDWESFSLYAPYIQAAAEKHDIPPALFFALVYQESKFKPFAISPCGAYGFTQLMPATASHLKVNRLDPVQNINGGAKYLSQQLKYFKDVRLALAAYNAGPGAVKKHKGIPAYKETMNYVASITADYKRNGGVV